MCPDGEKPKEKLLEVKAEDDDNSRLLRSRYQIQLQAEVRRTGKEKR